MLGVGILWTEVIIVALNSPWSFACLEESIIISRNEIGMPTWKKKKLDWKFCSHLFMVGWIN